MSQQGIGWSEADEQEYAHKVFQSLQLRDGVGENGEALKNTYEFDRLLGRGGMSLIICLVSRKDGTQYALKIPRLEAEGRWKNLFERENGFLRGLSAPTLVAWRGYAETHDGTPGILMEYLSHGTLERTLNRVIHPVVDVHQWFEGCLDAVGYLHAHRVAHRDLKPSNFMLTAQGKVKLIDLALATMLGETEADRSIVVGTPVYMPPETRVGLPMDYLRGDLFALTIVFAEMRMGHHLVIPYQMPRPVALLPSDLERMYGQLSHLSRAEQSFVKQGTSLNPSMRFDSIRQMKSAFEWATL